MATSAANLQLILDISLKHTDIDALKKALHAKGLLPKKLLEAPKAAKVDDPFASKAAREYAATNSVSIKGLKGTSVKGKLTVKDLKDASAPAGSKVSISPAAAKFARDNGIDITTISQDGKILLADVKELLAGDSDSDSDGEPIKLSTAAARAVKQWKISEEDLETVDATGRKGEILLKDIADLIAEAKAVAEDDMTDID